MYIVLFCLIYLQIVSLRSLTKKLTNDQITADCGTITVNQFLRKHLDLLKTQNKLPVFCISTFALQIAAEEISGNNQLLELQFSAKSLDKKVCYLHSHHAHKIVY